MILKWITEHVKLLWMPNQIDFTELDIGYDVAVRPEIVSVLNGQITSGQSPGLTNQTDRMRLILDEHELAIG